MSVIIRPLQIADITQGVCRRGNLEALKYLSSRGIKLDYDACYVALAHVQSPNQELLKWLVDRARIKNVAVGNKTMLHIAVENDNLEIAKLLIAAGADVNGGFGYPPPLDGAIITKPNSVQSTYYKDMIELFASHGADLNITYGSTTNGTMLHRLAYAPNISPSPQKYWESYCQKLAETAKLLISLGADVNVQDGNGYTPLHLAADSNNIEMINLLVSHGANLKAMNYQKLTPLYSSIATGHWGEISRELVTIGTLITLENNAGITQNWTSLKDITNKVYDPKNKKQILTFLTELEKSPSTTFQKDNLEKLANKIIDDTPKTLQERMNSCNPSIALTAANEAINNPDTLNDPLELFGPSLTLFMNGKKDDAVFWFYAAQLRVRYQLAFENGDRGQLLAIMLMSTGPIINNYAFQDVSNFDLILDKVLAWDKKTPNPFREKIRTDDINKQIEQIYAGLRDLKSKLDSDKNNIETKARKESPAIESVYFRQKDTQCQNLISSH